jgi:hypothetical protein
VGNRSRDVFDEPNIVHRFATFHFDTLDLSPISIRTSRGTTSTPIMDVLQSTRERAVPDWIEQGRRLSGLLLGVSLQAARPTSMAKEWYALAKEVLAEKKVAKDKALQDDDE